MIRPPSRTLLLAIGIGAVAIGLIATAIASTYEPSAAGTTDVARLREERSRATERIGAIEEASLLRQRADSLAGVLAQQQWAGDSLLVLADTMIPAWRRDGDTRLVRRAWSALHPRRDGLRVVVAFVRDTGVPGVRARLPMFERAQGQVLPTMLDGRTCLVVQQRSRILMSPSMRKSLETALGDRSDSGNIDLWAAARDASLGACGWIAAYGLPGSGMRAWLDSTGWRAATMARFVDDELTRRPWRQEYAAAEGLSAMVNAAFAGETQIPLRGCAAGNATACSVVLQQADLSPALPGRREGLFVPSQRSEALGGSTSVAVDPRVRFLDDLRRDIGHERMRALWTDARAFPEAFAANVGESLPSWTARWMARSILDSDRQAGPRPSLRSLLPSLLLIGLLFAASVRRINRQVIGGGR